MTFSEYVVLLQRRWRTWGAVVLLGIVAATAVNTLAPRTYTATSTSFVTVTESPNSGSDEIYQGSQFVVQRVKSYAQLSSSPDVLQPVIDSLGLQTSVRDLRERVEATSPPDTVLLQVSVKDSDAVSSAKIADAISVQLGKTVEGLETPRGRVVSRVKLTLTQPADVPLAPSSPRALLNLLLGAAGGAAMGLIAALLRNQLDRRIKRSEDVRTITGVAPIGSVLATRQTRRDPLVALNFRSLAAERYRAVRTSLKLANVDRELRHFVVSSPMPNEGKTTVAANLAISWAQTGARVCLVDAGLRQPMTGALFDISERIGLSDVLAGDVDLDQVLVSWDEGSLTVLPAGSLPPDPAGLLGSTAMSELVSDLKSRFDLVIYDSPPMLSVTDSTVLARVVDGLVLVVKSGATTRDQLAACVDTAREARLRLLGTVNVLDRSPKGVTTHPYYENEVSWPNQPPVSGDAIEKPAPTVVS